MPSLPLSIFLASLTLQTQSVEVTENLRIGSDSAPDYQFTRIRQGIQDKSGNLYLLLPRETEVRVFSPDGRFLRRIGRKGEGPGEMMSPVAIGWRGDTLWVRDVQLNRVNLTSRDGMSQRTILDRMPAGQGRYVPGPPAALLADGSLLGVGDAPSMIIASGQVTSVPMVRFMEGSRDARAIRDLSLANLYGDQPPGPQQPGIHFQQPLSDAPLWHAAQDGSSVAIFDRPASANAKRSHYVVTIVEPSGSTKRQRKVEYTPKPLTRAVRDSLVKSTLNPFGRSDVQLRPEVVYTPDFLPPVTELFLATDGLVWLKREFTTSTTASWDILDANLQPVKTVSLPSDFRLLTAQGDRVWGTRMDENEVPYVVRYSIAPSRGRK